MTCYEYFLDFGVKSEGRLDRGRQEATPHRHSPSNPVVSPKAEVGRARAAEDRGSEADDEPIDGNQATKKGKMTFHRHVSPTRVAAPKGGYLVDAVHNFGMLASLTVIRTVLLSQVAESVDDTSRQRSPRQLPIETILPTRVAEESRHNQPAKQAKTDSHRHRPSHPGSKAGSLSTTTRPSRPRGFPSTLSLQPRLATSPPSITSQPSRPKRIPINTFLPAQVTADNAIADFGISGARGQTQTQRKLR